MPRLMVLFVLTLTVRFAAGQTYNVRGGFNNWGQTPLNSNGDGSYSRMIIGLNPGDQYEWKIAQNDWASSWPPSNVKTPVDSTGAMTFHFFPGSLSDGWSPAQDRVGYNDSGQFGWEITGSFNGWNDTIETDARQMIDLGAGLYSVDYSIAAPGPHMWKFRESGSWNISIGTDFGNSAANCSMTTTSADELRRFELDLPNGRWQAFQPEARPIAVSDDNHTAMDANELWYKFGNNCDIAGNRMVISTSNFYREAIYVYVRSGTTWHLEQKLVPPDGNGSKFYTWVAISGDTIVAVGYSANVSNRVVFVFVRDGTTWTHQATLVPSVADHYLLDVDINEDTAVVGSPFENQLQGAAYVFVRNGTTWTQEARLTALETGPNSYFGQAVAVDGDKVIVGAAGDGEFDGAAFIFGRSGPSWNQEAALFPPPPWQSYFGASVAINGNDALVGAPGGYGVANVYTFDGSWELQATLETLEPFAYVGYAVGISDSTAVIGAPRHLVGTNVAAFVFVRNGSTWNEQARLEVADGLHFGSSVAIDGNDVVVGDPIHVVTSGLQSYAGAAFVFDRTGVTWTQVADIIPGDPQQNDGFGGAVALSGDRALVGVNGDDGPAGSNQGSAYVLVNAGASAWTIENKLTAADAAAGDGFGGAVSLDGDYAVIGAPLDDGPAGFDQGSAYVFYRSPAGWLQQAKLLPADAGAGDRFGDSVGIHGGYVVVGAPLDDGPAGADQGAAYVFVRSGSTWSQQAKLVASDAAASDWLGLNTIGIHGPIVVVGAEGKDGPGGVDQGAAYVFGRIGAAWTQTEKLTAADGEASDAFGSRVAISDRFILIGAPSDDINSLMNKGSAYVFEQLGADWFARAKLVSPSPAAGEAFGYSVAINGDLAAIGSVYEDGPDGVDQGAAYVFRRSAAGWSRGARLSASDGAATSDHFGVAAAVSDGTVLIGWSGYDDDAGANLGAVQFIRVCGACADTNCDGTINPFDIQLFLDVIGGAATPCSPCAGDANGDGTVNPFDIQRFTDCVTG